MPTAEQLAPFEQRPCRACLAEKLWQALEEGVEIPVGEHGLCAVFSKLGARPHDFVQVVEEMIASGGAKVVASPDEPADEPFLARASKPAKSMPFTRPEFAEAFHDLIAWNHPGPSTCFFCEARFVG